MKHTLFSLCFLLISWASIGQISYEERIELELKDGYGGERIMEFGKLGVMLTSVKVKARDDEDEWKYDLYDTDLKLSKTKSIYLDRKFQPVSSFRNKTQLCTLYRDSKSNYVFFIIDVKTFTITNVEVNFPKNTQIWKTKILGDYAFCTASIKKEDCLFSINWKTGEKKFIPINIPHVHPNKINVVKSQLLNESNEILLFVKVQTQKDKYDLIAIPVSNEGKKSKPFNINQNVNQHLIDITASRLSNGKYVFTGTYSKWNNSSSQGLYFAQGSDGKIDFIEFYSFFDLDKFLSYLPKNQRDKLEKKRAKKEKKGKKTKTSYQIATHNIIELEDGYLFLGEAYYRTYRVEVSYGSSGGTQHRTVFNGNQYTHAVLCKFNKNGQLIWDQIFEMSPKYKPFYAKRFISIAEQNQSGFKLAFTSDAKIFTKIIGFDGKIIEDSSSDEIQLTHEEDKSKPQWSTTNLSYWYGDYFIAYGRQKIKNKKDKKVKKKRKVYFISKIKYESTGDEK